MAVHPHHDKVIVLGRGGRIIRLLAALGLGLALLFFTLTVFQDSAGLTATVLNVVLWGPIVAVELLLLSSRVEGRGNTLVLVNLVRTATIPTSTIAQVDRNNGVQVVLTDGRRLGCIGYGSSLIALFTGNRRGHRMAKVIDDWLTEHPAAGDTSATVAQVRVRTEALVMPVVGLVVAPALGFALYHLR